jgi:hypothetical protein
MSSDVLTCRFKMLPATVLPLRELGIIQLWKTDDERVVQCLCALSDSGVRGPCRWVRFIPQIMVDQAWPIG